MRRELRLRQRRHFDAVFQKGRVWSNNLLVLRALSNNLPHNRFGFVTSKRVGNAVTRNKTRRRLREAVRSLHTGTGWDVVVAARPSAAAATFAELKRAVADLLARAMILAEDASPEGERA